MEIERILKAKFASFPEAYRNDMPDDEKKTICDQLYAVVHETIEAGGRIRPNDLYKLTFFPEIAQEILETLSSNRNAYMFIASSNPEVAFTLMKENYATEIGEKLELMLLAYPEYALKIIEWSSKENKRLRFVEKIYSNSIERDISCGWLYFREYLGKSAEEYVTHMKAVYEKFKWLTPQSEFFSLCFENKPLTAVVAQTIKLDPKTALMTKIAWTDCPTSVLTPWITYPQWAYHILTNVEVDAKMTESCIQTLIRSLPWLYQYLEDINMSEINISEYNRLMATGIMKWGNLTFK